MNNYDVEKDYFCIYATVKSLHWHLIHYISLKIQFMEYWVVAAIHFTAFQRFESLLLKSEFMVLIYCFILPPSG